MKSNRLLTITLFLFGLMILSPEVFGQEEKPEVAFNPNMSFMVSVEKANYFPWESVALKARVENKTDTSLVTMLPDMLMDGTLIVESANEKREFGFLTVYRSLLVRQPAAFKSGETYEQEFTLECCLDEFFPKSGNYMIRFVLNNSDEKRKLVSNTINITIDDVTGIDKEALDFITQNKVNRYYPMLFSWKFEAKTKEGRTLLEEFVSKYSRSIYGEYAILQLGRYYYATREYEKAKVELGKLRNSKNPRIVKDAKSTLTDVEKYCPTILPKDPSKP